MSRKGSRKLSVFYNDSKEALYDASGSNPLPDSFPSEPIWPEWSDAEVNAETWGNRGKSLTTPKYAEKSESNLEQSQYYFDPEPGSLPSDVQGYVVSWKRPHEVFPPNHLVVYDGGNTDMTFKASSKVVSNCPFYKQLWEVFSMLQLHATIDNFPVALETPHFVSNTRGQPWQPWHHIYGNSKAGKENPHRPVYAPYGKYIVRLYYLASWRKFVVDDQIPCDADGRCLLPTTQTPGELWPILLVKAVLKILSLTLTNNAKIADIPLWSLFTGYITCYLSIEEKSATQAWRLINSLLPSFTYPEEDESPVTTVDTGKGTAKDKEKRGSEKQENSLDRPVLILSDMGPFPEKYKDVGDACIVDILMTRDVPLKKLKKREPTERWKRIRWVHWASEKGLWTDELLIPPYRCLHVLNLQPKLHDLIKINPEMENRLFVSEEADDVDQTEAEDPPDKVQWIDFFKLYSYTMRFIFLMKPEYLTSRCRITYLNSGLPPTPPVPAGKGKNAPNIVPETFSYYMSPAIKMSANEPPIIFCESTSGIFITLSLWVSPRSPVDNPSYLAGDVPSFLQVYHGSVLLENYDWRSSRQNSLLKSTKTVCNGACCLELARGRHAFKLWLDTDSPFVVDIYSNTPITVGMGPKIRSLMTSESLPIARYITILSTAFIELSQKFGKPEFRRATRRFYTVLEPLNSVIPGYYDKYTEFIEGFLLVMLMVLRSSVPNDEEFWWMIKAVKSAFVSPSTTYPLRRLPNGEFVDMQMDPRFAKKEVNTAVCQGGIPFDKIGRAWTEEEAKTAVTIQRFYRGHMLRELLRYQIPGGKEFKIISEKLKKICEIMFVPGRKELEVARVIRELIAMKPHLLEMFYFHKDISNVTVTEEFTGKIVGVEPNAWVPMIRFTFACHSPDPLPCTFYHSCNLDQYTVTVTNNDTNEEIFRLVNTTCPHYYALNEKGYTLFVYGWNESETKTVNWRLEMTKMKYFLDIHPCNVSLVSSTGILCHPYQPQPLTVVELRNHYVPNEHNQICKCLIYVQKTIMVTIRLSMSYEDARFYVKIYQQSRSVGSESNFSLEESDPIVEAEAKSSAIIFPYVLLSHQKLSSSEGRPRDDVKDQSVYVLEAILKYRTWPLTKREWGVVETIRVNGETWQEGSSLVNGSQSRKASFGNRKRSTLLSRSGSQRAIENPYWYLQVVCDFSDNAIEVVEDRSYQEMVKDMKEGWEESDPGRKQRGRQIQLRFLREVYDEMLTMKLEPVESKSSENFVSRRSTEKMESSFRIKTDDGFEAFIHELGSFSYLLQDDSTTRYNNSPRIIPWVPMAELMAKYSRGNEGVDVDVSEESSRVALGEDYNMWNMSQGSRTPLADERKELLKSFASKKALMDSYLARERRLSNLLMTQARQKRAKAIEWMKSPKHNMES